MFRRKKPEEPVKQEGDDLQSMKAGDYMIHVFIQCGKGFKMDYGTDTFNAMVKVKCNQLEQFSKTKTDCPLRSETTQFWSEHLFLELKKREAADIQQDTIEISVQDKGLFRDKVVGSFEIDVAKVYGINNRHALEHQWVALCSTNSENPEEVKGFIKMSIAVHGPGDNTVRLGEDPEGDQHEHDVMMPANIKRNFK